MTTLSSEQKAFLEECMLEFSNRFSASDEDYKQIYESDTPPPPIMCPWHGRQKLVPRWHKGPGHNSRSYERDHHKDRDNYNQNNEHKLRDRRYRPY